MERPNWAPGDIDLERPSVARVYDYWLGGAHNFAADRAVAKKTLETMPELRGVVLNHRAFLRRAVRYLLGHGVRQFLDFGFAARPRSAASSAGSCWSSPVSSGCWPTWRSPGSVFPGSAR